MPIKITFNYCQAIRIVTFKMINAKRQTPNAKRQTPNAKRQTPNAKRQLQSKSLKKTAFKNAVSKGSY
ncbi:hypothetical protein [Pseudoalteromonas sp. PS1M3]|uniref:hypothetical protein n=1 Tax=Pseudoalteromonas sp. PS1M3 TaxID=87791 RepID=UPI0019513FD0|nr:hypothetical protein [Pseudoalteromonas sp. PS1M3]